MSAPRKGGLCTVHRTLFHSSLQKRNGTAIAVPFRSELCGKSYRLELELLSVPVARLMELETVLDTRSVALRMALTPRCI